MDPQYTVVATSPSAGIGSSTDSRIVGPYDHYAEAERAATALISDPRLYRRIVIKVVEAE